MVSADGEQLGIIPVKEALRIAREKDLDLVEVAPAAKPPVCKIMDYGKYRYEQSRREREARKRQKVVDIKEIRLTPKIETHLFACFYFVCDICFTTTIMANKYSR